MRTIQMMSKKDFLDALSWNVFVPIVVRYGKSGITIEEVFLTDLNDIHVTGTCNACNGKVARLIEFGQRPGILQIKQWILKKSIQN